MNSFFTRNCETVRTDSEKLDRIVSDIKRDFRDGVNMILLVGMLEGWYLVLTCFYLSLVCTRLTAFYDFRLLPSPILLQERRING